jgi:succinyl-CoA synthetase beta subunit
MKIHEYQAKEIFSEFSIPVVAHDAKEAKRIAEEMGGGRWVIKAQIHAGGRGKGGGVRVAETLEAVGEIAEEMIGMTLVTPQTGPQGKLVSKVLVEEGITVKQEFYVGAVVDRPNQCPVLIASAEGGMGIEELAATHPDRIVREWVDVGVGISAFQARNLVFGMGIDDSLDCTLVEINPLVITEDNRLLALDAKIEFDDNALYRHKELL